MLWVLHERKKYGWVVTWYNLRWLALRRLAKLILPGTTHFHVHNPSDDCHE